MGGQRQTHTAAVFTARTPAAYPMQLPALLTPPSPPSPRTSQCSCCNMQPPLSPQHTLNGAMEHLHPPPQRTLNAANAPQVQGPYIDHPSLPNTP
jgi:hypothetical protein